MDQAQLNWLTNFIWGIADDVLRDVYVRGKYATSSSRWSFSAGLTLFSNDEASRLGAESPSRQGEDRQPGCRASLFAKQAFYNTSPFTLRDLKARAKTQQLKADFEAYLDGFSPNVQDILNAFEFRNQIPRLSKADALGTIIERMLDRRSMSVRRR